MLYLVVGIVLGALLRRCKGVTSHDVKALGCETVAQEVVDEEVVQFVWANQIFGFLLDIACFVGRNEFWRYGRVDDIVKRLAGGLVVHGLCNVANKVLDEGLGDAYVYGIHAHVVAVVGGPAQCQFGKVARSHDNSAEFVAQVHENLCAFACLSVFIHHVVHGHVVANVFEMLGYALGDVDFVGGYSQFAH